MAKPIQILPIRSEENRQLHFNPTFLSAIETLISDDSNPVFITCTITDTIVVINDFIRKEYGPSFLHQPFNGVVFKDECDQGSLVCFQDRWYKMDNKMLELNGISLTKITLNRPDEQLGIKMLPAIQSAISMILHRFRSPLTGTLGYLDLLSEIIDNEKESIYLDRALGGVNQLSDLLDELEPLTGSVTPSDGSYFDPVDLLLDLLKKNPDLSEKVVIKTKMSGLIYSCNQTLYRLLSILLENASIYSSNEPGSILITMDTPNSINISNNGPAIPDDLIDKIFEPFVSGRSDRMGNGLTVAQSLAEQIGAVIHLKTNSEKKVTFELKFPYQTEFIQSKKAI